ncbi:MAG TPA: maleylpyruvate isomerase family mycothiol-dependent enzyme [Candidatus Limnocylindrales bacterium]
MELRSHIGALAGEGRLLAGSVTDFAATVPTCPDWTVRDLLRHIGMVHGWARCHVAEARQELITDTSSFETWPEDDDAALVDWYRAQQAALVETLEAADPELDCYSFLPGQRGTRFWARRQAHETAIHRVDAQGVTGAVTATSPEFAADGVDEILHGFFARRSRTVVSDPPRSFGLHADDAGRTWAVTIGAEGVNTVDGDGDGDPDVRVTGSAFDLYLLLWNRRELEGLDVQGDPAELEFWRDTARVKWSQSS